MSDVDFFTRLEALREKELVNGGDLSIDEYGFLVFAEFIQNDSEAPHTLARAKARFREESIFLYFSKLLHFVLENDYFGALKSLKSNKEIFSKTPELYEQLCNRYVAICIASITHVYSVIKFPTLGRLMEYSPEDLESMCRTMDWTIDESFNVHVRNGPAVKSFVKSFIDPAYGPVYGIEHLEGFSDSEAQSASKSLVDLKQLLQVSDELMKVHLPPKHDGSVTEEDFP